MLFNLWLFRVKDNGLTFMHHVLLCFENNGASLTHVVRILFVKLLRWLQGIPLVHEKLLFWNSPFSGPILFVQLAFEKFICFVFNADFNCLQIGLIYEFTSPINVFFKQILFFVRSSIQTLTHLLLAILFPDILGLKLSFIISSFLLNKGEDIGLNLFCHDSKLVCECLIFENRCGVVKFELIVKRRNWWVKIILIFFSRLGSHLTNATSSRIIIQLEPKILLDLNINKVCKITTRVYAM